MPTLPKIIERRAQPYIGMRGMVSMDGIPAMFDRAFPLLFKWMEENGIAPVGAAFCKYNLIDMEGELELEVGVPVATAQTGEGDVVAGILPAGRYATITHTGPYDQLMDVNAVLIGWAKETGVIWDAEETDKGDRFVCRLEIYETDPGEEPDPSRWITEVTIRIADRA
ncbi:GyrI-like domain-containing protein [Mariluticola halotolerans]|uniref:GyrI-like domain-containing protein n=1 Tax=Mariluticola halotolerans TaxID=2909283 RepID=UPI0026E3ACC0|nr:GyrI-like domain-containing protein [Mariluticola halotolerans]UJQ94889.1 GyrI-like domain-containing protein [Mariluticola halotolerans]